MIESMDENVAYTVPIDLILSRFHIGIPRGIEVAQPSFKGPSYQDFFEGNKYLDIGDYNKAIQFYDKVIFDPNIKAYNNKGLALVRQGKFDMANTCFDKVLDLEPKNSIAWYNKGVCLASLEKPKFQEAIDCFSKAIELDPSYTAAMNNKASYMAKLGDHSQALDLINKCLETDPHDF